MESARICTPCCCGLCGYANLRELQAVQLGGRGLGVYGQAYCSHSRGATQHATEGPPQHFRPGPRFPLHTGNLPMLNSAQVARYKATRTDARTRHNSVSGRGPGCTSVQVRQRHKASLHFPLPFHMPSVFSFASTEDVCMVCLYTRCSSVTHCDLGPTYAFLLCNCVAPQAILNN